MPAERSAPPPWWARAIDLFCLGLVIVAAIVAIWGGLRLRVGPLRLSLTSPPRLLLWAVLLSIARHAAAPANPIYRDLTQRLGDWRRALAPNDTGAAAVAGTPVHLVVAFIALFVVLTAVMTYPLVWHLADSVSDPGDPLLNLWAMSWVAHQLPVDPRHLFDANIFAPERYTLAYSETLIAPAIVTAPLRWLGANGILIYNLVFAGGFVVSGVGAALLVRSLTGSTGAGIVSGVVFAFLPFRFDHWSQLQLQQGEWIPLALWAFHRVVWSGRVRDGVWLGVFVAAQLMSCMYYGLFFALFLLVWGVILLVWQAGAWRRWLIPLAVAVVVALALFAPAATAYLAAHDVVGERGSLENLTFSATWTDFLAAPGTNVLLGWTARRFGGGVERQLYQGVVAMALAALALWPPWSGVRVTYALGLLFALDITLGFNGLTYRFLYDNVSAFRALRIPALAIMLVGVSLAVLAGFGVTRILARVRTERSRRLLIAGLCAAVLVECLSLPMPQARVAAEPPPIYTDMVRDRGAGAATTFVEVPMIFAQDPQYQDPVYMYYSTFHWQRMVNGYSGFFPPSYQELAAFMRTFPDARSMAALRERKVRYAVVHGERLEAEEYRRLTAAMEDCACGWTLVRRREWQGSEISLFRLE